MRPGFRSLTIVAALVLGAGARHSAAQTSPLRIAGKVPAVTFQDGGATRTGYRVTPGKPIELLTSGEMTLLISARAVADPQTGAASTSLAVLVTIPGAEPSAVRESLTSAGASVALSDGGMAFGATIVRVPITAPSASVRITAESPAGAIVGFARAPLAGAVATGNSTPAPAPGATPFPSGVAAEPAAAEPMGGLPVMPLPLIRRKVERLGLGPRVAFVVPAGAVDPGTDGTSNLYAGAELRLALPVLERRLALTAEGGTYLLRDVEPLAATSPFGIATDSEVTVSTRVVPLLGGALWRVKLDSGDRRAVFAGANGGVVLTSRTEDVEFRRPTSRSDTRLGAQARAGFEQRLGPGRTVVEASYLHVTEGPEETNDAYLGGAFLGLQYRFSF